MHSPAMNYTLGGIFLLLAVVSFTFLSGSTAVFIGIFGAITGSVFVIRGLQASKGVLDPRQVEADAWGEQFNAQYSDNQPGGFDWDAHYQRNFGQGNDGNTGGPTSSR